MEKVKLYNTLTRNKDEFAKNVDQEVGLYTCGPTVYNFAHLGNLRTYIFEDILKRTLLYNGYQVKHVMNITDVGHLTGDMDMGEDKLELEAAKEHKSAWEIAEFYAKAFKEDLASLNVIEPSIWCKATDNINEQIELIKILESKGFVYQTSDGLYFDTSKFPAYNKLSHLNLEELKEGARVERNDEKRNPTDFALWKLSPSNSGRQMEWDSPWGVGFPGWHLECSAMSLKYLKGELDIHCGGVDHINIHHTNEIAQSEAATGEKFFDYWLHGAFLNIAGGKKMAKSEDNFLTLKTALSDKGIDPLAFRYACLMTHYRKPMEWSGEGITNASNGLRHLYAQIRLISNSQFPISKIRELGGRVENTTNNRMEMMAAIEGLKNVPTNGEVEIHTDSEYVMKGITIWIKGWQKNNWRTKDKREVMNRDLWEKLFEETEKRKVAWSKVAGHSGHEWNDRCDEIAQNFADGLTDQGLYDGPQSGYHAFHR